MLPFVIINISWFLTSIHLHSRNNTNFEPIYFGTVTNLTQKLKKRKKAQDEEPILKTSRTLENGEFYAIRGGLRIKVSAERLI